MLQRGRGEGFLAALSMEQKEAAKLVTKCVLLDTRWDRQVESRERYFASLVERLNIDRDLFGPDHYPANVEERDQWLGTNVLEELAKSGDEQATRVLFKHLESGVNWDDVLRVLSGLERPDYQKIISVLEDRFDSEKLALIVARLSEEIPWAEIASDRPWVQTGLDLELERRETRRLEPTLPDMDEGVAELLQFDWPMVLPKRLIHRLSNMLREGERDLLLAALADGGKARWVAFNALGHLNDPSGIEFANGLLAGPRQNWDDYDRELGLGRRGAGRYFGLLGSEHTLPFARMWQVCDDALGPTVHSLFERHAEQSDVPLILERIREAWELRDFYALCSYVTAIGRFPRDAPSELLGQIYEETEYSYSRGVIAEVLYATGREHFLENYGAAAVYDSEPRVNELVTD